MVRTITKHLHILLTPEQHKKLELFSFYSGKSIGDIIRKAIDNFNEKDFKVEGGVIL